MAARQQVVPLGIVSLTTTQRDALSSPAVGNTIYNSTTGTLQTYGTGGWSSRTAHGDSNYTILPTDRYVALNVTLTALRTWTLPAANAFPPGVPLTITDETGAFTMPPPPAVGFYLSIVRAGSDTIEDPVNQAVSTSLALRQPNGSKILVSDGTSKWIVVHSGEGKPAAWWTHPRDLMVPNNVWTPLAWGEIFTDPFLIAGPEPTATTTIASGSNSVALPQATINVASTTGFAATGFCVITIGGADTIFGYTGLTGTTFTGCNTAPNAGISTGTMLTGQAVTQIIAEWQYPTPGYYAQICEAAWAASPLGVRGIRVLNSNGVLALPAATTHWPALNIANQHTQVAMQAAPTYGATLISRYEVFQNSGGVLNVTLDGIQSPSLMQVFTVGQSR